MARKRKAPDAPPEPPPLKRPAKRKTREPAGFLPVVEHPSHGKVVGDVFVIGDGDCGQLGMGEDVTEKLRPALLKVADGKVLQVAAGGMHTVALAEDGTVWSWGVNDEGALGRETAGELWEKAPEASGKPQSSDEPGKVQLPAGAERIVQVSAGDSHTAALTERGKVYGWGTYRDGSGVMGFSSSQRIALLPVLVHAPRALEDQVVKIVSGADHVLGLTAGGKVLSWGSGQQGQLGRVGERMSDRDRMGTLTQPHAVPLKRRRGVSSKVADVSAGTYSSFAVTADGHVSAWGLNNYGQLGVAGDAPLFSPAAVTALDEHKVREVRGGQHHTLAITQGGGLLSFGRPTYGRLGRQAVDTAADTALPEPKAVEGLDGCRVVAAAAGLAVSGCVTEEGAAYVWGFGTSNQLGKGDDDEDELLPKRLAETKSLAGRRILQLEFGGQHVAMLATPQS